jgi:hypothetical protein
MIEAAAVGGLGAGDGSLTVMGEVAVVQRRLW